MSIEKIEYEFTDELISKITEMGNAGKFGGETIRGALDRIRREISDMNYIMEELYRTHENAYERSVMIVQAAMNCKHEVYKNSGRDMDVCLICGKTFGRRDNNASSGDE